jgi:hypothetical protein
VIKLEQNIIATARAGNVYGSGIKISYSYSYRLHPELCITATALSQSHGATPIIKLCAILTNNQQYNYLCPAQKIALHREL